MTVQRGRLTAFLIVLSCLFVGVVDPASGAVTSTGELNVRDEQLGRVPTASNPELILTLLVDRSQAEPGEEIKAIEVLFPEGVSATLLDVGDVVIDGVSVGFEAVVTSLGIRFVLDTEIDNFLNSRFTITFSVRTPDLPVAEARFRVALRNLNDVRIGEFIKPGEIDGDPTNNNDYTLDVFPNIPPPAPTGVSVTADPTGENDAIVTWDPVDDRDVRGYFVFRDDVRFDVIGSQTTTVRDVDVPPGTHTYSVVAYKSRLVLSIRSAELSVLISPDTAGPESVAGFELAQIAQGIQLIWLPSPSPDVVRYDLFFNRSGDTPQTIHSVPAEPELAEYKFVDRQLLDIGRYEYSVQAYDEAGNVSAQRVAELVLSERPFPNPFTPLSADPTYNRVRFPRRAVPDAEGDLIVRVFDLHGRQVWETTLATGNAEWDGRKPDGEPLPGGIYVYQIEVGGRFDIGSIVLVR